MYGAHTAHSQFGRVTSQVPSSHCDWWVPLLGSPALGLLRVRCLKISQCIQKLGEAETIKLLFPDGMSSALSHKPAGPQLGVRFPLLCKWVGWPLLHPLRSVHTVAHRIPPTAP